MSKRISAKLEAAHQVATHINNQVTFTYHRVCGTYATSLCETDIYVAYTNKSPHVLMLNPVIVVEGDTIFVSEHATQKNTHACKLFRRAVRELHKRGARIERCKLWEIRILSLYGVTGLVLDLGRDHLTNRELQQKEGMKL